MATTAKRAEFWAAVVAEAQAGDASHATVAAKHGVTEATLKYHFYKARKPAAKTKRGAQVSIELGPSLRVRFAEGCDPAYVAALIAKLR